MLNLVRLFLFAALKVNSLDAVTSWKVVPIDPTQCWFVYTGGSVPFRAPVPASGGRRLLFHL